MESMITLEVWVCGGDDDGEAEMLGYPFKYTFELCLFPVTFVLFCFFLIEQRKVIGV